MTKEIDTEDCGSGSVFFGTHLDPQTCLKLLYFTSLELEFIGYLFLDYWTLNETQLN